MLLVGWLEGHPACKKLSGGMVTCLDQGADLHMAWLMPLPLTTSCSSKSRLVLTSWFCLSGAGSSGVCVICLQFLSQVNGAFYQWYQNWFFPTPFSFLINGLHPHWNL